MSMYVFTQHYSGLDADRLQVDKDGSIFSYGSSIYEGDIPDASRLTKREIAAPIDALKGATSLLQLPIEAEGATAESIDSDKAFVFKGTAGTVKDPEARLVYFRTDANGLKLTWRVETDILSNWLLTYVDATTNDQIHAVVDYSADAAYQV